MPGEYDRRVMGGRVETGDTQAFALQLFQLGDTRTAEDDQVVSGFHGGDEHDVVALDRRLDYGADINDRRIAADQRLSCHLATAEKNRLHFQSVFIEQTLFFGDPNVALAKTQ